MKTRFLRWAGSAHASLNSNVANAWATSCPPYGTRDGRSPEKRSASRTIDTSPFATIIPGRASLFRATVALAFLGALACTPSWAGDWRVSRSRDPMSGKAIATTTLVSDDSVALSPPYGRARGSLVFREIEGEEVSLRLQLTDGQIVCDSSQCGVTVRFDDARPVRFGGTEANDGDTRVLFLKPEQEFIESAATARRILVEFVAFRSGVKVLAFRPKAGLQLTFSK